MMTEVVMAQYEDVEYADVEDLFEKISIKKYLYGNPQNYQHLAEYSLKSCEDFLEKYSYFRPVVEQVDQHSLLSSANNSIDLLINGEEKYPRLLEDIANAKDHIHIQYYIIETEGIGQQMADILKSKAREGVEVRLLYDAFGSKFISRTYLRDLRDAGVEVAGYLRLDPRHPWKTLNNRNHRKIVIVDGLVSYLGGMNIADRYTNVDSTIGSNPYYWRDTHLRLSGGATQSLQYVFLGDWNFATDQNIPLSERYFPEDVLSSGHGDVFVQTLSSGPETENSLILDALLTLIDQTRDELLLSTPYYIPTPSLTRALKNAVSRGVNVQLMIPSLTDALLVNSVARSYYRTLIKSGVKVLEYQKGFLHAKTIVSDGKLAVISSANLDRRSFFINFEVSAFVYDPTFAQQNVETFYADRQHCNLLTLERWDARPPREKLYEFSTRVFAPLF